MALGAASAQAGDRAGVVAASGGVEAAGATLELRFAGRPAPPHRLGALTDPPRLALDFDGARAFSPELDPPAPPVRALRWGLAAPGVSRLIVELDPPALPARPRASREPGGDGRLAFDLRPADAAVFAAFAEAAPAPEASAAAAPPAPVGPMVVAIDPGHGGIDPGAARGDLREKDVTLAFAFELAQALREAGFAPMLTREADVFARLGTRVARARAAGASALLSIHADALGEGAGAASGVSVYTLSAQASDAEAALLAERENQVDRLEGGALLGDGADLAQALIDLVRRETQSASQALGAALVAEIGARAPLLSGRPLRSAGFRVLKAPDIPSALIELGFLSSATDRARLSDPDWRARVAAGIAEALKRWRDAGAAAAQQAGAD
ncbi:MAG: N-acetylmuramoyl-L-alanine amidase [Rubrimonas sp.]|uniref:N-acetylmuramoyl-L-alanine amidase n=1 Tax=Rubrimonas sp. TaxID=2036015 RepID=UPI002FDD5FEC